MKDFIVEVARGEESNLLGVVHSELVGLEAFGRTEVELMSNIRPLARELVDLHHASEGFREPGNLYNIAVVYERENGEDQKVVENLSIAARRSPDPGHKDVSPMRRAGSLELQGANRSRPTP